MARRADRGHILQARRAAVRNSLTDHGITTEYADRWFDAWEIEAANRNVERNRASWRRPG